MYDVRKALNIKIESPYWDDAYKLALNEPQIPSWLTEEYARILHKECGVLTNTLDNVLKAIPYIQQVPDLCLLAKTLYHILATQKNFSNAFTEFELPTAPETVENPIGYDCVAFFPIMAHIRPSWEILEKRGIEKDILTSSFFWADRFFQVSSETAGRPFFGTDKFKLYDLAIYLEHLMIGRLRFEIHKNSNRPAKIFENKQGELCILMDNTLLHKTGHILGSFGCTDEAGAFEADFIETDEYYEGYAVDKTTKLAQNFRTRLSKKEWKPVFTPGDNAIKVHIPNGGKLDKESCESAYQKARDIFTNCFPETHFKGFLIGCWMLSPELKDILSPQSNIIEFQNKYEIFPLKNNAADAFMYVFGIKGTPIDQIDFANLPEANSLMRGLKAKALEGKFIHQFNGFIPWK